MSVQNPAIHTQTKLKTKPKRINRKITLFTLALFMIGFFFLASAFSYKQASIFLIAGILGLTLYHAHYGFTSSFRAFITTGSGKGIRAQMYLFLIANLLFLPVMLITGASGSVSPVGLSVIIGSFIFGIGMQIGDGCASGTLYHLGGGDLRGVLTLIGFIIGSVIGSAHFAWWMATPNIGPVSFLETFGSAGGLLFNVLIMVIVFAVTVIIEKRRTGRVESLRPEKPLNWRTWISGPWPLVIGSVILAIGNTLYLIITGKAWGVTSAFALWGAKIAQALGMDVTKWEYWQTPANEAALNSSIFNDITSVSNFGLILGALLALGLSGGAARYLRKIPVQTIVGLLIGGILMGYGARIAFGCNIGAYFSGIASFSLHGWVWMVFAMLGSIIGVKLRPVCRL